ncbi:Nop13p Ecym_6416 [Eremothecium cymbalariae DBVPG|uniref:RRM domain-containing protein n=1 Tax=Eremothecium cymbalariae (strain CBS 270.75 / DBVPG 7215 / KCTC 17166 / NRRL Y-17582) TaxID=931890 RepID=G8JUK8_ERECY|nr:hypothetical protein Ecym_6416 [Eremothecium cymbalariae DBVPG\
MSSTLKSKAAVTDELVTKALSSPTKKRTAEDEIEIDLNQSVPLSKKQKRLLRRGKISLEELNSKFNIDPKSIEEYQKEGETKKDDEDNERGSALTASSIGAEGGQPVAAVATSKEREKSFGVWIGNLSYCTTKQDIIRFITAKTSTLEGPSKITEADIVRFKMPLAQNDGKIIKNKGFAYVDFKSQEQMLAVIGLSELQLNGRNLLVKNSKGFTGRPDKNDLISLSKNPPSRILFVGNLSFNTTEELLKKHFQHCGNIVKIRMATFEDTGKCKGFAFVDFKDETGPTASLTDKSCRKIANRPIRMEYGEDRSKRHVKRKPESSNARSISENIDLPPSIAKKQPDHHFETSRKRQPTYRDSNNRVKSSVALASAQRASVAIVPSQGKKVKF